MLPTVNAPAEPTVLNPGQCVRVGVAASGLNSEHALNRVSIHAIITSSDIHAELPLQPSAAFKLLRPAAENKLDDDLAHAGVKIQLPAVAALAVSASKWCVPPDAHDGKVTISADVEVNGKHTNAQSHTIRIESIASAAAADFNDKKQLGDWTMSYDAHPEPARLLAALRFVASQQQPDLNGIQFLISAFAHDAPTAALFGPLIAQFQPRPKLLAMAVAARAKVTFTHPPIVNHDDGQPLDLSGFPDAYDLKSSPQPWQNLDLLWAEFLATGSRKPIAAIAQALVWKSDYDSFQEMKKEGKKATELTPSITHGVTYGAAQWSLGSFYRADPIAADYIRSIREDPSTPQPIRDALQNLNSPGSASFGQ
ncbi:MAG TPA: hypothetical protein VGU25_15925 [Acidobacteriaceae bacterium]|nr:hypothetical protein [Acidobacteriaceae bacterium]